MKRRIMLLCLLLAGLMVLSAPALALEGKNVNDKAGILSEQEAQLLDASAREVGAQWDCGIYILIVEDYREYAHEPYMAAYMLYHEQALGLGQDHDGVLLMLSMRERDFAFFVYGENAEYALDEYGQRCLEDAMLDDLAQDQWYSGLSDFIEYCDYALERANQGDPVRESRVGMYLVIWGISAVLAGGICLVFYSQMKTARVKTQAHDYISPEGLQLTRRGDLFTHRTVRRRKIESSKSGNSRSHSGGGGSGRSGKF